MPCMRNALIYKKHAIIFDEFLLFFLCFHFHSCCAIIVFIFNLTRILFFIFDKFKR